MPKSSKYYDQFRIKGMRVFIAKNHSELVKLDFYSRIYNHLHKTGNL